MLLVHLHTVCWIFVCDRPAALVCYDCQEESGRLWSNAPANTHPSRPTKANKDSIYVYTIAKLYALQWWIHIAVVAFSAYHGG